VGTHLDSMPLSGIARVRDLMFSLDRPFRLDQGDVSFAAPASVKAAIERAIAEDRTHYLQTNGLPRLRELLAEKLVRKNGIPVASPEEVIITNGGVHALYLACQALLEPGDEVVVPDPEWPSTRGVVAAAGAVPVACPLHEHLAWRFDLAELERALTTRTRAIYVNSPNNPTGGVLTRADITHIADLARARGLWIISDEAYEDIVFDGTEHVSPASCPGLYPRTISVYTFSKSYAMTGLRLGYLATPDPVIRERVVKLLFLTASNVSSIVQYGGIGALEDRHGVVERYRLELEARRDLFYRRVAMVADGILSGAPPLGAFYAFLKVAPGWEPTKVPGTNPSLSWRMTEHLIERARIGSVPGVDFGPQGEGYVRFCFARERGELEGALHAMAEVLHHQGPGFSGTRTDS
jgi:aspartate aminotransferase